MAPSPVFYWSRLLWWIQGGRREKPVIAAEIFPPSQKAMAIGAIVFAGTIVAIVGPLLVQPSSSLSENLGLSAASDPYIVGGFLLILAALLVFILVRPDPL